MVVEAVGIGMLLSLLFVETIGVAAGGIVVPGYIAIMLHHPFRVMGTIACAFISLAVIKSISRVTILYGRRLLVMCILVGYLLGYVSKLYPTVEMNYGGIDISTIGYVIPGLMTYWMERQGIIYTITSMLIVSCLARLILIVLTGGVILS
ncbi:poly-gamma-glutamate biosynthesis protein PgsC [candidate division WOR-3 bacterium JGI_Cruoil_03_44_89]|uniref:Poly-gamma-glutamate biosynthesis protein PgsC n=1 Tax=candidate division WOR-3 bacterium JGI_Cruoil_03_44_89 TaxID=1973748 RepID=A0A235BT46_UNCW3|nr:MAG: poly-gamma-glutamate biosynthesis protein PgsC [candidate division WOR-3 bacterium JGI_Cruoil_03_44_89]